MFNFFKLVDSNSWRVNRGTRYREGSLRTKHQVTVKSFQKKKLTAFCFYCSLFWCRRYRMKHLWPERSKSAFPVWALMVRCRTSLNFESKCTLYQSKHYSNFSWSQSSQFVSPHKKFDVPIKALFFRRF